MNGLPAAFYGIHAENPGPALIQVAHDIAGIGIFAGNSQFLNGFEENGLGLQDTLLEVLECCGLEGHLGRINRMIGAVVEVCMNAHNRIAGQRTCLDPFLYALFDCREEVLRNIAADDGFGEFIGFVKVS